MLKKLFMNLIRNNLNKIARDIVPLRFQPHMWEQLRIPFLLRVPRWTFRRKCAKLSVRRWELSRRSCSWPLMSRWTTVVQPRLLANLRGTVQTSRIDRLLSRSTKTPRRLQAARSRRIPALAEWVKSSHSVFRQPTMLGSLKHKNTLSRHLDRMTYDFTIKQYSFLAA